MPRNARILNEKQVYHIMLRGNNREKIFTDDEDKAKFINTLLEKKKDGEFFLYAYCIMDNHTHLLLKVGKDPLARTIKRIGTSYAYYFNKKYKRIGHVFQDRYRSESVCDVVYLLALIRYVHQNPVKPGLAAIDKYKWSSFLEYVTEHKILVEVEEILDIFSVNRYEAVKEFIRFNSEKTAEVFIDVEDEKKFDEKDVDKFIMDYLHKGNLQLIQLKNSENKLARVNLIKFMAAKSSLSLREIAIKLGISREMVRKIVSEEPSP